MGKFGGQISSTPYLISYVIFPICHFSLASHILHFDFSIRTGRGVPQQHYDNVPRGSERTMRLVRSSMQTNLRLYRRKLNAKENIFDRLRDVIMHDVRGVIRRERKNVKFYITGDFIFQKGARPEIITNPPIFFNTDPKSTISSRSIEDKLDASYKDLEEQINEFIR